LIGMLGLTHCVLGDQFIFQQVPPSVVDNINSNAWSYYGVASGGTSFFCVGSNSVASLAVATNALTTGGYLTNRSAWLAKNIPDFSGNLNGVAYGSKAGIFVAAGATNNTFAYINGVWTNHLRINLGIGVDAMGVAYNPASDIFSAVTASYQAAWQPASNPTNWNIANDTNVAFVESFRSVTSMGSNNLALCGIRGDVRISSNGGQSWNTNRIFDFSQPDLLAIASDGSNSLVCAGTNDLVLVSTNAGNTWATNIISGISSKTTFYAAAYTGPGDNQFILAGSGGNIFIASNNISTNVWVWAQVASGLTTNILQGAAVATSGPFQGVTMLVGDAGTLLVGGTLPPAPTNTIGIITNILNGDPGFNQVLGTTNVADIIVTNPQHPAASTTIDWYDAAAGGNLLAASSLVYSPTNSQLGTYTYWAAERDIRTGLSSTTRTAFTLVIAPPPPPLLVWITQGAPATNLVFSWFGTFWFQTATNLTPPVNWINEITNATPGVTNSLIVPTASLPMQFFRLYLPSN